VMVGEVFVEPSILEWKYTPKWRGWLEMP